MSRSSKSPLLFCRPGFAPRMVALCRLGRANAMGWERKWQLSRARQHSIFTRNL